MVTGLNPLRCQDFFSWDGTTLTLDNGHIQRKIVYSHDSLKLSTRQIRLSADGYDAVRGQSVEFSFLINDNPVNGMSGWEFIDCIPASDNNLGKGAKIRISQNDTLEVAITYLMYPGLPLIRKIDRHIKSWKTGYVPGGLKY